MLLVERFDRVRSARGWARSGMVSALTLFALDELMARYASYETFAEIIRHRVANPRRTLEELFARLVFNVLSGNTDDHARNHAAFWDGAALVLTPAYDICPQARTGNESSQAMLICGDDRRSRIETCVAAASQFLLTESAARAIAKAQIAAIEQHWEAVCEEARLTTVDRRLLWRRQFLNPYALQA